MFLRYHDKRSNPHIEGIAVRERTKTINQGRTRAAALRRAASRKPLKLISSHSIFSDLTCSRVTSNQTPDHDLLAHVRAADPSLRSRADRNSATPPIPFLLYFSCTMRSSLRFADPWLTGYPWHLHAGQSGASAHSMLLRTQRIHGRCGMTAERASVIVKSLLDSISRMIQSGYIMRFSNPAHPIFFNLPER